METKLSLLELYQAITDDCKIAIENNVEQKVVDEMNQKVKNDLKGLISFYRGMLHNSSLKGNIRTFALDYLDIVQTNIDRQKYGELNEDELYLAYLFLFSFNYINRLSEIDEITKFNYESYKNFSEILKTFGNPEKLKENYENNAKKILDGKIDKKNLKNFIQLLEKRKLTQNKMPEATQKTSRRKRKNTAKKIDLSSSIKSKIKNEEEKKDENEIINNIDSNKNESNIKIEPEIQKESPVANDELNAENNNEINNEINEEANSNNIIKENTKIDDDEKKEEIKLNNESSKKDVIITVNSETKEDINENNKSIKQDSDINNKNGETSAEDKEMKLENSIHSDDMKNEIIIDDNDKKPDDIKEVIQIIKEESKSEEKAEKQNEEELLKEGNISYKDLIKIVLDNKAELNKTKEELSTIKEELSKTKEEHADTTKKLLTRIEKLEKNQKLMYYQISMYHSRDISKNIYYYFAKHLNIPNHHKPFFDLVDIMEYIKKDGKKTIYSENEKEKLRKFFKSIFFVNKVNNRTMHNNLTSNLQNNINEYKSDENDDLLSLIPPMSFDKLFESLTFYIENNAKYPQIQKVMKHVYENEYILDKDLKEIKDTDCEAIKKEKDGSIQLLITLEEINEAKSIFLDIKDFAKDCQMKTWG